MKWEYLQVILLGCKIVEENSSRKYAHWSRQIDHDYKLDELFGTP